MSPDKKIKELSLYPAVIALALLASAVLYFATAELKRENSILKAKSTLTALVGTREQLEITSDYLEERMTQLVGTMTAQLDPYEDANNPLSTPGTLEPVFIGNNSILNKYP